MKVQNLLKELPIVCPICWDHAITPLKDIELIALHRTEIQVVPRVATYYCSNWHVFALFSCPDPTAVT